MTPSARDHAWVDERLDAFCFSAFDAGVAADDVLDAFSADRSTRVEATFDASFNGYPGPTYVLVGDAPGGLVAAENNGWTGVQDDTLARGSRSGRMVAYYRSVNADMTFALADGGVVVAVFDPLLDDVPAALSDAATGLDFDGDDVTPSAFALLERLSGVRIEQEWLDSSHARYEIPSP